MTSEQPEVPITDTHRTSSSGFASEHNSADVETGNSSNHKHHLRPSAVPDVRAKADKKVVTMGAIAKGSFGVNDNSEVTVEKLEEMAREAVKHRNALLVSLECFWAAVKVFCIYLITIETILSLAGAVATTCYWYFEHKDDGRWDGGSLSWVLLGFALVFPMSNLMSISFRRREFALVRVANLRSASTGLFQAHLMWDWSSGKGREKAELDMLEHCDKLCSEMFSMQDELIRFLTLPTSTLTRHQMTISGMKEAQQTMGVASELYDSVSRRLVRYGRLNEEIKTAGLSGSEMSRVEQFHNAIQREVEGLRILKMYRTPQALRAFSRIFTLILPAFYGPSFANVAISLHNLGMGIAMACITTLALTSIYESVQVMEDPFTAYVTLDGVNCLEELFLQAQQLLTIRDEIFPNADPFVPPKPGALIQSQNSTLDKMEDDASKLEQMKGNNFKSTRHLRRRMARQSETRQLGVGTMMNRQGSVFFYTHG